MDSENKKNLRDRYRIITHAHNNSLADILCRTPRYKAKAIDRNTGREIERAEERSAYEAEMNLEYRLKRTIFLDSLRSHF